MSNLKFPNKTLTTASKCLRERPKYKYPDSPTVQRYRYEVPYHTYFAKKAWRVHRSRWYQSAEKIISLAKALKSTLPKTTVVVSGLTTRTDNDKLAVKVIEVNSTLKRFCRQNHIKFIDNMHSNITPDLNRSRIHEMGTSLLASNFNNSIYNREKWDVGVWEQWRSQPEGLVMLCKYFRVHGPWKQSTSKEMNDNDLKFA